MTTDRELLELAARAMGYGEIRAFSYGCMDGALLRSPIDGTFSIEWNPLANSADCAAMCAKLMIGLLWVGGMDAAHALTDEYGITALTKDHNNDREAAWRYAATMVAAKIGGME